MIQRKQTLFLLAIAIIAIILFFVPFLSVTINEQLYKICLMPGCSPEVVKSTIYVPMILNGIILIGSLVSVFQFKNRILQQKLSNLLGALNVVLMALFFLLSYTNSTDLNAVNYSFGAFLPAINVIFAFLAAYFIKKDERLVRSADRIR